MQLPKIRENLLVQDLNDEVLIYDRTTNKSYCLNSTAKIVFNSCDGKKTLADVNLPEEIIYLSLDELKKQNLIQAGYISPFAGMNRREVIRKVGLASMVALPVISSLVAPNAADAGSVNDCANRGGTCVGLNQPYCVGRAGQSIPFRIDYNSNNGSCSGNVVFTYTPYTCVGNEQAGADRCLAY